MTARSSVSPMLRFDLALAICVMHHVPPAEWVHFLAEMKRVVKPGGAVFIVEHNPLNPLTRYVVAHSEIDQASHLLPSSRLRKLMRKAGLRSARTENSCSLHSPSASSPGLTGR